MAPYREGFSRAICHQPFHRDNLQARVGIQRGMRNHALVLAALLSVSAAVSADAQPSANAINGTWTAELHSGKAFLQVRTAPPDDWKGDRWGGDWSMGQSLPIEDLGGIPANDERFTASGLKFELRREAGILAFEGAFRDGRGAGLFTFTPRPQFDIEMKAIGYTDDLPLWRRFQLAVHDVGPKYIRAMKAEGYDKLTLDQVQRARTHGVTVEYVKALKAEGYQVSTIEDVVRTRDHGVTPEYIQGMRKAGFKDPTLADLVRAKDHGVTPEFAQELREQGINPQTLDGFVRLRDHGVRAAFITDLKKAGYDKLDTEEIVRARDHSVTAEYIADMKDVGLRNLTLSDIVRLRDHGVTPGFVNHARARGFKEDTADGIIQLKNRGLWQ
jgi:hypothetical protein